MTSLTDKLIRLEVEKANALLMLLDMKHDLCGDMDDNEWLDRKKEVSMKAVEEIGKIMRENLGNVRM